MSNKVFVNLPVKDLDRSVDFFNRLGFSFDPQLTDENAGCLIISDDIFAMLLTEPFFRTFTKAEIADARTGKEAILALGVESRQQVDELVDKAFAAGASRANDTDDQGFMYGRSFLDPDGHMWEVVYMDPSEIQQQPA
jgi:predicted lactoylglutathione lyase